MPSRKIVSLGGFSIVLGLVGALAACSDPPQTSSDLASIDVRVHPLGEGAGRGIGGGEAEDVPAPAQAIRQLDTIASRSLKMHISPITNAVGALGGVRTSVVAGATLPGFTYAHAFLSPPSTALFEVPDYSFEIEQTPNIGSATVDAGGGDVTLPGIGARLVGSVPGGFTFTAASSKLQSPYMTVEQAPGTPDHNTGGVVPGNPDLTVHFAIGNPDFFPSGARIRLDLGPGNSVDLVKSTDAAGVSTIAIVPVR